MARKLLWWSFLEFFRTLLRQLSPQRIRFIWQRIFAKQDIKQLRIAIAMPGGIGDILMYGLMLKELSKHIHCEHSIDVYTDGTDKKAILDFVFQAFPFVHRCIGDNGKKWPEFLNPIPSMTMPYDIWMRVDRCAIVVYCDYGRVDIMSPWLGRFCKENELFRAKYSKFFKNAPYHHPMINQWSILCKKKRIQQPDPCQMLGINDSSYTFLHVDPGSYGLLSALKLQNTPYITLQRGFHYCVGLRDSTRLWPIYHYKKFIKLFHQKYPSIKIVQLGHSQNTCASIPGIDIDLIGKTSLREVAILLKHSLFHLDGESGMVHMKKFLNGQSIVLFGPTSAKMFGYPENINITGDGCHSWCEWVSDDWYKTCLRGFAEAPCMASIAPERVLEAAN
ncbi:MAG: hypothetical protein LBG98_01040, partial [Puniceicoccales bacterium]|nr:hypothetical protein [Puniceicoccales bacterium]